MKAIQLLIKKRFLFKTCELTNFMPMHRIEFFLVRALLFIFSHISIRTGKWIAIAVYFIIAYLVRYRKKLIMQNLSRVYGNNFPSAPEKLLKGIYKNFVFLGMEFLQNSRLHKEGIENHVTFHNYELLREALAKKKGVVIVSGHLGNFEWLGQAIGIKGHPVSGIAKRQSNPYVNELMEKNRKLVNVSVIYKSNSINNALKAMKENNEIIGVVADQNAHKRGIIVDFLGQPSSTAVGPVILHIRSGAPILFGIAIRKDYGIFDCYFQEISMKPEQKPEKELILEMTQQHAGMLEKWIYKYPEQWFWMHHRWKKK